MNVCFERRTAMRDGVMTGTGPDQPASGPVQSLLTGSAGEDALVRTAALPPTVTALDEAVGGYAAAARAANTWRAYRSDFAAFERWCIAQSPALDAVPASPL